MNDILLSEVIEQIRMKRNNFLIHKKHFDRLVKAKSVEDIIVLMSLWGYSVRDIVNDRLNQEQINIAISKVKKLRKSRASYFGTLTSLSLSIASTILTFTPLAPVAPYIGGTAGVFNTALRLKDFKSNVSVKFKESKQNQSKQDKIVSRVNTGRIWSAALSFVGTALSVASIFAGPVSPLLTLFGSALISSGIITGGIANEVGKRAEASLRTKELDDILERKKSENKDLDRDLDEYRPQLEMQSILNGWIVEHNLGINREQKKILMNSKSKAQALAGLANMGFKLPTSAFSRVATISELEGDIKTIKKFNTAENYVRPSILASQVVSGISGIVALSLLFTPAAPLASIFFIVSASSQLTYRLGNFSWQSAIGFKPSTSREETPPAVKNVYRAKLFSSTLSVIGGALALGAIFAGPLAPAFLAASVILTSLSFLVSKVADRKEQQIAALNNTKEIDTTLDIEKARIEKESEGVKDKNTLDNDKTLDIEVDNELEVKSKSKNYVKNMDVLKKQFLYESDQNPVNTGKCNLCGKKNPDVLWFKESNKNDKTLFEISEDQQVPVSKRAKDEKQVCYGCMVSFDSETKSKSRRARM